MSDGLDVARLKAMIVERDRKLAAATQRAEAAEAERDDTRRKYAEECSRQDVQCVAIDALEEQLGKLREAGQAMRATLVWLDVQGGIWHCETEDMRKAATQWDAATGGERA